jgi:thiamine biosynthesis lipoprotein
LVYFGTVCEINVFCNRSEFAAAQENIQRIFTNIEKCFSPGGNDLVSHDVVRLYRIAKEIHKNSNSCFDITIGPLTRLWGFLDKSYRVPSKDEVDRALSLVGMDKIEDSGGFLSLSKEGMELDWGGIAKGFGLDLASQTLKSMGISRGYINAGGDLICWGKNPDHQVWKVGIEHPRERGYIGILFISETSAATTGDYQRFFAEGGIRYHHIIDPHTGFPSRDKQSVTVIGPQATICDALSTAIFVSYQPQAILKIYKDYGAIIVGSDGKISILGKPYSFRTI